jgi:cysteine desulfurase
MNTFDPSRLIGVELAESGLPPSPSDADRYRHLIMARSANHGPASFPEGIYLDANATTPPLQEVVEAVVYAMRPGIGNPASAHAEGNIARQLVESARDRVCILVGGAEPEGIIFVSGGTEANNTVIRSFSLDPCIKFITAPVEHPSVLKPLRREASDRIAWLHVDPDGRVDPDDAGRKAASALGAVVLIIQAVNSETGIIQPITDIIASVRRARADVFVHVDAAQAVGRIPLDLAAVDADSLSFSGHKLHGPLGTGVLMVRDGKHFGFSPLILGGGQEHGMRSGTPNVPGIAGLGAAMLARSEGFDEANRRMTSMRDHFERTVLDRLGGSVKVNGGRAARVSNTSNLRFEGLDGMQMLACLDAAGVRASQGSACSSGRPQPSAVLLSMGLTERDAFSSLRFSFSILNTEEQAIDAAEKVASIAREIAR